MIAWLAGGAGAAPVLEDPRPPELEPVARCAAAAEGEAGVLPAPDPLAGDRIAVVVGVPCHRSEAIPPLRYATRDAARMAETLRAAGFAVLPLLTVVDRADLLAAVDAAARAVPPDGTLVVYFSGHGVLREEGGELRRSLVLSDTELTAVGTTGLDVRDLEARLTEVPAAWRVLVQDTCFAHRGGGKSVTLPGDGGLRAKGLPAIEPPVRTERGDLRLYASRLLERAVESPELRGSVYTAHLLAALADPSADLDGDGCTGWLEAHARARARTVADRGGLQVPVAAGTRGAEDLASGCVAGPPRRAVVDRPSDDALQVRLAGPNDAPIALPAPVDPGRYRLTVARWTSVGGELVPVPLYDGPIRLRAGQWIDVEDDVVGTHGPRLDLRAVAAWAGSRSLPRASIGAEGTFASRDRGRGRAVVGATVRLAPGPGPDRVAKRTIDLLGVAGWSVAVPRTPVAAGPWLSVGWVHRTVPERASPLAAPSAVGTVVEAAGSAVVAGAGWSARAAIGARLVPVQRGAGVTVDASPVVLVAAGPGRRR